MIAFTIHYSSAMEAIGWTLLNSVWQACLLFLAVYLVLRVMPMNLSRARYAVACVAMAVMVLTSVTTFSVRLESTAPLGTTAELNGAAANSPTQYIFLTDGEFGFWETAFQFLETNMTVILIGWSIGAILFSLRIVSGWFFLNSIRRDAIEVEEQWYEKLRCLALNFGMTKRIRLAETTRIDVPMVIGFFKPVILIPTSMLSGLSPEQIETIFVHELAHIRRNDYIINLIQTILESIFFFNPFVWLLSGVIRREREYCCDDEVVSRHGEVLVYAQALASLEEIRLQRATLALSLAENKNLLFNRIRRIMEKSAKNSLGRERMVPALLLVIGLVCASWLTIRTDNGERYLKNPSDESGFANATMQQDTIIKDKKASSKTTYIRIDEEGNTHEQVYEQGEGDGEFDIAFAPIDLEEIVDFPLPISPLSPMEPFNLMPPMVIDVPTFPDFLPFPADVLAIDMDSIPGKMYYRSRSDGDWKEFSEEFEKKFREQFGDFYKKNEKEFEKMMKEMEENFAERYVDQELSMAELRESMLAREEMMQETQEAHRAREESVQRRQEAIEAQAAGRSVDVAAMKETELAMQARAAELHQRSADLAVAGNNMKAFERKVREMLIKDGYIKSTDEIKSFKREQSGAIEVNGKKIKDTDIERYNNLYRQYFKPGFHFWNVE